MNYRRLGSSGLKLSELSLGAWVTYGGQVGEEVAVKCMSRAYDAGVNFFDNAEAYADGNAEKVMGNAIKKLGWRRESIVVSSKVFWGGEGPNDKGLSRKHIMHSIDNSLRRLDTDYVDLYQIHRFDSATPVEETMRALDDIIRAGKALYIGASAMYGWQFMKMLATSDRLGLARFVTMQNYYNLIYREEEREMLPLCRAEGIAVTPFSPLARGFVVGNRRKEDYGETVRAKTDEFSRKQYYRPEDFAIVDRVTEIAKKRDLSNAQVALAWVLHQPGITAPIIGASKPGHLEDAMKALTVTLDEGELKFLSELYKPRGILANM